MESIFEIPDEPFPENLCFKLLTENFSYIKIINRHYLNWDNINPKIQLKFINKIKKSYTKEWINNHIDTDFDDY